MKKTKLNLQDRATLAKFVDRFNWKAASQLTDTDNQAYRLIDVVQKLGGLLADQNVKELFEDCNRDKKREVKYGRIKRE